MRDTSVGNKKTILKIVSVFIAVILWLFITYTEDKQIDVTINSVDVKIADENPLNENGLMIINKASIPKASVVIRGKRGDIIGVMDNISASVDVSHILDEGEYNLKPNFEIPSNAVYIAKQKTMAVPVEVAKVFEKNVDVKVMQKNQDKNATYIVESIPVKNSITVRGAREDIESIHHAAVYVDVSEVSDNGVKNYSLVFENEENSELLIANDVFVQTYEVEIFNYIYEKQTIPVDITLVSSKNKNYSLKLAAQSVEKIDVGIKTEDGKKVTSIKTLPLTEELKLGTNECEVLLDVPKGIYIEESKKTVKVKLEVYEKTERLISVPVKVKNPTNKSYELLEKQVDVRISGPEQKLKSDYITAVLDISSLVASDEEQTVTLDISSSDEDVEIKSTWVQAKIKINN